MSIELASSGEILFFLQRLAEERTTGETLFRHRERSAKVYLAEGKILWAFASGQTESFQGILLRQRVLSKEALLKGINESRAAQKKHLDEILAFLGVSSPEDRRRIILRHSRAALETVLAWGAVTVDISPRPLLEGQPMLSFGLEEILASESAPAPQRSEAADVPEVIAQLHREIPLLRAVILIDGSTGAPISSFSENEVLDTEVAAAFYGDIFKSVRDARDALAASPSTPVEEFLISTKEDVVLVSSIEGSNHFIFLSLSGKEEIPAARAAVQRAASTIGRLLP